MEIRQIPHSSKDVSFILRVTFFSLEPVLYNIYRLVPILRHQFSLSIFHRAVYQGIPLFSEIIQRPVLKTQALCRTIKLCYQLQPPVCLADKGASSPPGAQHLQIVLFKYLQSPFIHSNPSTRRLLAFSLNYDASKR